MEFFNMVNEIRLKSTHHEKYLVAEKDEETVSQDRKGKSSKTATWNVELVQGGNFIRLKSCYGKYLTALDDPFHLGMNGKKVVQTFPTGMMDSSSIEWEPIRDGHQFKLKSRCGDYLRANGGLPPWRNSVTHDIPHRSSSQDWILWQVDILDMQVQPIGGVENVKEEKEAKPNGKKQAAKAAKLLAGVLKRPKEKKEGKSKEEKTEEEVEGEEGEEEEESESESERGSGSGSGSEVGEGEGEGSPNSKFGFRKFLHKLKGGSSEGEGEGEGEGEDGGEGEGEGEDGGEGEGEGEGEGGSPHSRFGFRKFLHTLNGGDGEEGEGEGEGEGGGEGEVEFNFEFEF